MASLPKQVKRLQSSVRGSFHSQMDGRIFRRIWKWMDFEDEDNQDNAYQYSGELPCSRLPNRVKEIDWHVKENSIRHHTELFEFVQDEKYENVVVRRGQPFRLSITFMLRKFDLNRDRVTLDFNFGPKKWVTNGSKVSLVVKDYEFEDESDWAVRIVRAKGWTLCLEVSIAPDACVGVWKLSVTSALEDDVASTRKRDSCDLCILFNPWCKEDTVYLEDEKLLEEYVLNDSGKIYTGTYQKPRGRPWSFGQFDMRVLTAVMCVLETSNIKRADRGNSVKMARAISSVVNGLMKERTDGIYEDGTAPYAWTSSADILECYMAGAFRPVKYGQCWVFSAVTTTICRALGIPCRSVSSFASARETNSSLSADRFFDIQGNEVYAPDELTQGHIWCFHSWNDVWMARPDLDGDYGGWQAIDATPRGECESASQCGPASLAAIRKGEVGLAYDTDFVFTEVNADITYWGENTELSWNFSLIKKDKCRVGQLIVTKDPKKDDEDEEDYEVIVQDYVGPKRRQAQSENVRTPIREGSFLQKYLGRRTSMKGVEFELHDFEVLEVGQNICIKLTTMNTSNKKYTVLTNVSVNAIFYTGEFHETIAQSKGRMTLDPRLYSEMILRAPYYDNWSLFREFSIIRVVSVNTVVETGERWCKEEDLDMQKPRLRIHFQEKVCKVEKPCKVEFSFTNPLPVLLTGCQLRVTEPGRTNQRIIHVVRDVGVAGDFECSLTFIPLSSGRKSVTASFISNELCGVTGSKNVIVK